MPIASGPVASLPVAGSSAVIAVLLARAQTLLTSRGQAMLVVNRAILLGTTQKTAVFAPDVKIGEF